MIRTILAALISAGFVGTQTCLAGNVYGLVVGADEYEHLGSLGGAVNDARDVHDALKSLNARDARVLLDGDATREAIFRNWHELVQIAGEGDILVLHYAGHGGRQEAILEGHEAKDNVFLLPGFSESGPGVMQRIVDNEIGHLLAKERDATVVFVADSCYAGDMMRKGDSRSAIDVRAPAVRFAGTRDAVADRVRELGEVDENALTNVIWLYAQDENMVTQEITLAGERRGALSYAFARALRGDADRNDDGILGVSELKRYVNRAVTKLSEHRQRPEVNAGSRDLSIRISGNVPGRPKLRDVRIFYTGRGVRFDLKGVTEVADRRSADIVLDVGTGALIYKTGDVVAEFDLLSGGASTGARLQGAIDKWRLIPMLLEFDTNLDPVLSLAEGDRVYRDGEEVRFTIRSSHHRHVTMFNLAHDGTVQLVAPVRRTGDDLFAGRLPIGQRMRFRAPVEPPFGADHLVAITTREDLPGIDEAVSASHGKRNAAVLAERMVAILQGKEFGMDWIGVYTRP